MLKLTDEELTGIGGADEISIIRPDDRIFCCLACNCANSANSCGVLEVFLSITSILASTGCKACRLSGVSWITFCWVVWPFRTRTSLEFGGRFCSWVWLSCAELAPPMMVVVVVVDVVVEGTSAASGGGEREATVTAVVGRLSDLAASSTSSLALGRLV